MSVLRRQRKAETVPAAVPTPRFVCRTCGEPGPFYVARNVTNWIRATDPYRTPKGDLTYGEMNVMLPGDPGPALAYLCGNCRARCDSLEELVIEPSFLAAVEPA